MFEILSLVWVAFLPIVTFIAIKRLDKPGLPTNERTRLKAGVIALTAATAIYSHRQTERMETLTENMAAAIPDIQTGVHRIDKGVAELTNARDWNAFLKAGNRQAPTAMAVPKLVTGSPGIESIGLPPDVLAAKDASEKNNDDASQIKLALSYVQAARYTLARQVFEALIQTSRDRLNTEIADLMSRALRAGLGDKIANRQLRLAWVLQWDEERSYKLTAEVSDDTVHWASIPLQPSDPAGSVIRFPLTKYIQVSARPDPNARQPILYQNTIMLRMGLVDRDYKLVSPFLLTMPRKI